MLLQGADEMYEFLSSGMEDLQKLGEIFVSDRLKAIRVIPAPKVSVGVPRRKCTGTSFESGQFWHGGTGRDSFKI